MRNEACCLARTPSDTSFRDCFQDRGRLFSGDNAAGILQRLYCLLSWECETSEYVSAVGEVLALLPCSTARLLAVEDNSVFLWLSFLQILLWCLLYKLDFWCYCHWYCYAWQDMKSMLFFFFDQNVVWLTISWLFQIQISKVSHGYLGSHSSCWCSVWEVQGSRQQLRTWGRGRGFLPKAQ